ncbi:hypothetical protein KMZ32_11500 [Phycicoccus sp. MAQZ13P-2]|uniref:hypothetical protein n=1 Tax=Phycicoccus mangrovi TaxID=2840470 RepID=UPI001C003221|nr:hypothetical protein [Phycicoccus mangrovi]MBT9256742.1 hypothetical protein [Phycicoccus mangrovi]MBT9274694.1 hypothetical protein [Phycicoccus mangrovi]
MKSPRRPRFLPFILTGAVIGFVLGAAVADFGWLENTDTVLAQKQYSPSTAVGYLGILGACLFALAAALLALGIERFSRRS